MCDSCTGNQSFLKYFFPLISDYFVLISFIPYGLFDVFRYYLFTLILSLTRDLYELRLLMDREERSKAPKSSSSPHSDDSPSSPVLPTASAWARRRLRLLVAVLYSNPPLLLDLLKNSCDIFIPLDRLGIYPTGPGFVGACGVTSSVLSILTIVHPWLKLKP